ncbi:hypothetical protein DCC79_00080 [bacterium]|nr:hypothetical protein [Chloroflexi bacterium CFX6]RIL12756.1 MAG: hypothetical protein DCC79_00080 [bacterium]
MLQQLLLLLALMGGFLLLLILFGGEIWTRVWRFQRKRRMARLERYRPRNMWRRLRKKPVYEVDLTTIRDFVLTLQLSLSLAETLAGALVQASRQFGERGTFGERLTVRVRSQLQVEPEAVIRALAEDFSSPHMHELADRLDLAHEGGLSYSEAVNTTLDDIEEEIRIGVEKEIERAPVMLTIPMIMGVFFAALALLGYPLIILMFDAAGAAQGGR